MANKKKNTSRQRRKQAARAQEAQADKTLQEVAVTAPSPPDEPRKQSRFLARWRKSPAVDKPEKTPWSRLQISVLILFAVAIQTAISPFVVPAKTFLDGALVFVGPQMLLGVLLAQPLARCLLRTRALGLLETLTVGATVSLFAFFAQYALVVPLITPSSTPSATATSTPSPSSTHSTASPSPSPLLTPTPAVSPAATASPKASPNSVTVPSTRLCPLDHTNCTYQVPDYEVETAQGMADVAGMILSIFMYSKIHRFFWMPKLRAKEREDRKRQRAAKSKSK